MFSTVVVQGTGIQNGFIQVPSGWTPINETHCGTDFIESLSYRISAPPDMSNSPVYTWSFCTSAPCTGTNPLSVVGTGSIVSYSAINPITPLQTGTGAPECDCHNATAATANGVTPTAANSLVIAQHASVGNNQLTAPLNFTSIFEHSNTGGPDNRESFQVQGTPTATGPVVSNYGTVSPVASDNIGCLVPANSP
jgi:hypothetical protein